jgi:membrane protease YdiL (CAAX protease family)
MKRKLLWGALFTLIGFPLIGWFVLQFFRDEAIAIMLRSPSALWLQLLVGLVGGLLLGKAAQIIVSQPCLKKVQHKYAGLIRSLNLSHGEMIFISLCAGFGEELLFRGALQPLIGLWITAVIFVAIHGYLNPLDWRMSIYGTFMVLAIAALGYATEYLGIYSACLAHAAIDYVLFRFLGKPVPKSSFPEYQSEVHYHLSEEVGEKMR